ncbi:hypothetical protein OIV83_004985 [Microbotryomycetes sp. JL201]|nr:hypothetical protein OIV83_004985 [Microbotryomycetes sp. JL201]
MASTGVGLAAQSQLVLPPRNAAQQVNVPADLDAVRAKLVQLIDQLSTVLSQLHYLQQTTPDPTTATPGILGYNDLLARYNLMLSHFVTLASLLSSDANQANNGARPQFKPQDRGRDPKKEKWSGSVVVPAVPVEEQKDWLVGMLLRTKQAPHVEEHLDLLVKNLPSPFNDDKTYLQAYESRTQLTKAASARIQSLKQGTQDEEWDWKGRVEIDEEEDEDEDANENDEEGGNDATSTTKAFAEQTKLNSDGDVTMGEPAKRKWTLQEVSTFVRTGRRPE